MKTVERAEFQKDAALWLKEAEMGVAVDITEGGEPAFTLEASEMPSRAEAEATIQRILARPGIPGLTDEEILSAIREGRR